MAKPSQPVGRIQRSSKPRWVALNEMKVSPVSQRELKQAWVDRLCENMDLDRIGRPTVNYRDGAYWIIDGQHRVEALRQFGFTPTDKIEVDLYEGLTEAEEAEVFLKLNTVLAVSAFDRFVKGVNAGRADECEVSRVVHANGCVISRDANPGAIAAVGTLMKVYKRSDSKTLGRTLRIIRDAYGDPGFEAGVIDGISLLCQRYNGDLNDETAVAKLSAAHGGVAGLQGKATVLRKQTGQAKNHCTAAAAVDIINSGKGGKKLPNWWATG